MPTFSNVHAELENSELHPPRDFSLAENDTTLSKNPLGNLQWLDTYWQRPVLGFAEATFPPFTLQHGDRYILFGNTNIGSTAIDTSVDISIDTSVWIDTSMDSTGVVVPPMDPREIHPTWGDVGIGDIVEYYQTDSKGNSVFEWRAVTPQSGYQVFNLADRSTYYFSGSVWKKQTSTSELPAAPQVSVTYTELALLINSEQLVPGIRYWISDRSIVVTATSKSSLSIEADHTRTIKANGQIKLISGTEGSINEVVIDGINLLSTTVAFNTDLANTAADLVDAVNSNTAIHGYSAIEIGSSVFIIDIDNRGAAVNGVGIVVTSTGIATSTVAIANGIDSGVKWFKVKYDLANDFIAEMKDDRGNVVSCNPQVVDMFGISPIDFFPWGYENVYNNQAINGLLVCFPNQAVFANNTVEGNSVLMTSIETGGYCTSNIVGNQSFLRLATSNECSVYGNKMSLSNIDMELLGGVFAGNEMLVTTLTGRNVASGPLALNKFNGVTMSLHNAAPTALLQNSMTDGEYNFEGASFSLRKNVLNNTDMIANGASVDLNENYTVSCSINISDVVSLYEFSRNQIRNNTTISLQRAEGRFTDNVIEQLDFTGNDCSTSFQNNKLSNYSELDLTNYTGTQFFGNSISSSTISLVDSSGEFNWNKIDNSMVQMQRHTGDCKQNVFTVAEITSNDSGSNIDNNCIDQSNVLLSNTNGHFSSNKATFYSNYHLDGYLGARVLLCDISGSSTFIASGNTQEQGRIQLKEITTLDISNESSILYLSQFRTPNTNLVIKTSQIDVICSKQHSTVYHEVELEPDGSLNTNNDELRYGGIFGITNSGTLNSIIGTSTLPVSFILKATGSAVVTIDSTAAGIAIANGLSLGALDGAFGHYVKISQQSGTLLITEAYTS